MYVCIAIFVITYDLLFPSVNGHFLIVHGEFLCILHQRHQTILAIINTQDIPTLILHVFDCHAIVFIHITVGTIGHLVGFRFAWHRHQH